MVWIHGGGFLGGSASQYDGPEFLLRNDVIVVSINYRLGPYGFMCLDLPEVSGNQGLKDQVLALRWINENIEAFGGNANQITVFGESAGGMSVNLHLLSNYESLFHRAIIQSGPAISPWVSRDMNNTIPLSLAEALEYNAESVADAINYLSTVDPYIIVKTAAELKLTETDEADNPLTLPCIEIYTEGVEHFMTEHPKNIKSTKVAKTPVIIGNNNNEMPFEYALQKDDFFDKYDFNYLISQDFEFGDNLEDALEDIRHFYIGDEKTSVHLKDQITDFASDFVFNHPSQRMAERFLELGAKTVYRYIFSYSGDRNLLKKAYNLDVPGAIHADELGYLFDMGMLKGDISPEDQLMIDRLTTLWTNFAKYGNPTPETSDLLPEKWVPITKTTQPYLSLDTDVTMGARPFHEAMAFWDVFYKLHETQHKYYQDSEE
uniref:Carboxylic ester hydrolase n=1 Tax=Heliothis virescens TaxID=7102 RepID=A0A2A4JU07_HELVI